MQWENSFSLIYVQNIRRMPFSMFRKGIIGVNARHDTFRSFSFFCKEDKISSKKEENIRIQGYRQ